MLKILMATALCFSLPTSGFALSVIDGSDKSIEPELLSQITKALIGSRTRDPMSAQVHSLQFNGDHSNLCGYVNLKNAYGAYIGFQPFQLRLEDGLFKMMSSSPGEITYGLDRLPFEFTGCDLILDIPPEP